MEYFPSWAQSIVCGFAHLDGNVIGIVGNQPLVLAGVLDIESHQKPHALFEHATHLISLTNTR